MGGSPKCGIWCIVLLVAAFALAGPAQTALARSKPAPGCQGHSGLSSLFEDRVAAPLPGVVDPTITGSFAVLRRAGASGDQPPPLNPLAEDVDYQLAGYYPSEIRQLERLPDGSRFFLVVGLPRLTSIPPARCLPRPLRAERKRLVEVQLKRAHEPVYCVAKVGGRQEPGLGDQVACPRFADVYTGANLIASDMSTQPVVELAPDGVATVRIAYRHGLAVTAAVSENAYLFTPPQAPIRRAEAAFERLVRRFTPSKSSKPITKRGREARLRAVVRLVERTSVQVAPTQVEWLAPDGHAVRSLRPLAARARGELVISSTG